MITKGWTQRSGAYTIDSQGLEKLWKFMEESVGSVVASADCIDKVERSFPTLDALLSYENASSKKVESLALRAHSDDFVKWLSVTFASSGDYMVSVHFECSEKERLYLLGETLDKVADMKRKLVSPFVTPHYVKWFSISAVTLPLLLFIFLVIVAGIENVADIEIRPLPLTNTLAANFLYPYVGLMIVCYAINGLRAKLIPPLFVVIGQGKTRYESWKQFWRFGFGTILVILTLLSVVRSFWS